VDFSTLALYNPWWNSQMDSEEIERSLLQGYTNSIFKRDYSERFDLDGNGVFVIRGPRQIGKSTLIKTTIASLLEKGHRRSILYLPLDTVSSFSQLRQLLLQYLQFSQTERKRFLFIDEISLVDEWQRAIKEVRDNTKLRNDVFVLTGSSAWDLKRSSERLPGRRGTTGGDLVLLPMTFREYLEARNVPTPARSDLKEIIRINQQDALELSIFLERLGVEWTMYERSGGIPSVIEGYLAGQGLQERTETFWDIIIGDIERLGLSRSKLLHVLTYIARRVSSRISWNSAAGELEVDTKTFQKYTEALGLNYLVITLKAMDINTGFPAEKKQKKLYFSDRFLLEVLQEKLGISFSHEAVLENLFVANCCYAFGKTLTDGLDSLTDVGYWYSKEKKEIDMLVDSIPIELKYQNTIQRSDLSSILKHFGSGVIVSRNTLNVQGPVKIIPLPLFMAMI